MIFSLNENNLSFPNPALADEDGLLAVGGDLSINRLLEAYRSGIFPWYSDETPILWYSPHQRFVLFPQKVKISKSMKRVLASNQFKITLNTAFADVIKACSNMVRKEQSGTWITQEMIDAYIDLHNAGFAHSVEVWQQDQLVGGLYGVSVNTVFCGESMFSKVSNASKLALIWLVNDTSYTMVDCQMSTSHLESMGAEMISRDRYLSVLHAIPGTSS